MTKILIKLTKKAILLWVRKLEVGNFFLIRFLKIKALL